MRRKLKPLLSILAIGLFLCFAMASEFLKESTNTAIEAESCEPRPAFTGSLHISVSYIDEDGDPASGLAGTLYISHQIIIDTVECKYTNFHSVISFHTDAEGEYSYDTPPFTHTNAADVNRVEVKVLGDSNYGGFRTFQAAFYDQTSLFFNVTEPPEL